MDIKRFIIPALLVTIAAIFFVAPINFRANTADLEKNQNKVESVVDISEATTSSKKAASTKTPTPNYKPPVKSESIETTAGKVLQEAISQSTGQGNQKKETVDLKINIGTSSYSYQIYWSERMTVYEVLDKASNENKFSLTAKWYGPPLNSYYITEIHGHSCECWIYVVKDKNGEKVPGSGEGASLDTVEPGNIIIWKVT
ncbi:MAG: hypothetical protein Q8O75_03330 [bacterium]|nr:hypothetical protein [bacterium]